ncbi:hypothetical protein [Chryseobacterium potabilaquae]|uniref:DUF3945 domain-containing protein n=1 Tax=Chryseobacterium potabilaquae TaxID=2675057 RepID=A0A6N4X7D1_9FLAO|nr:hypothetical protein [Chryseobacterium potabilaquae]CAA7196989.1 hypothetical protein CHRY9293_03047 [Chryseobacterium potabilaquae]
MITSTLPIDDLKKFGIIESDNSFTKKLSAHDIQGFLKGSIIIADNEKDRITFQLVDGHSRLNINIYERDKDLSLLLENSAKFIEYSDIKTISSQELSVEKKAYVLDKETNKIMEYDFIKNAAELTKLIIEKDNVEETNRYKNELLRLKELFLEKIDQFPNMVKEITHDLNIVSKEISIVNSFTINQKLITEEEHRGAQLEVNDPNIYQKTHHRKEDEHQEEFQNSISFRR